MKTVVFLRSSESFPRNRPHARLRKRLHLLICRRALTAQRRV